MRILALGRPREYYIVDLEERRRFLLDKTKCRLNTPNWRVEKLFGYKTFMFCIQSVFR